MEGYSMRLRKMVEMEEVQTVQLPNDTFVHRGFFRHKDGAREIIQRMIHDQDIIVTKAGHHLPKEVYVGSKTPKSIQIMRAGQAVIKKGVADYQPLEKKTDVITLDQLKRGKS